MKRLLSLTLALALVLCCGTAAFAQVSLAGIVSADLPAGTELSAVCVANTLSPQDAQRIIGSRAQVLGILYQNNLTIHKGSTPVYMQAKLYFTLDPVVVNTHKVALIYNGKYQGLMDYNRDSGVATHIFSNVNGDVTLVLVDPVVRAASAVVSTEVVPAPAQQKSPKTGDY